MRVKKIKLSDKSITRQLFNTVFIVYIIVTILMIAYEMRTEFRQEQNEIKENFKTLERFISPALADSLNRHSMLRLDFIAHGVMKGPAITGITIEPLFDYPTIKLGDVTPQATQTLKEKLAHYDPRLWSVVSVFAKPIPYVFPVYAKDETTQLAKVTVYTNQALIMAKFLKVYTLVIIDEILKALLLWLLVIWIGYKFLSKPLKKLTFATRDIAEGHMSKVKLSKNKKATELDVLAQSFNIMVDKIDTAQAGLLNTKRHLADIIDAMPSALIAITTEGVVTDCNLQAQEMTGVDRKKSIGMFYTELFPLLEDYRELLESVITDNKAAKVQNVLIQEKTGRRYLDIMLYPLLEEEPPGLVIRLDDVTSQIKIQEKLFKQEKLQSTLKLAAGMAHEINNPLGAILQGVQTVKRRLGTELPQNQAVAEELGIDLEKLQQYCSMREVSKFLESIQLSGEQAARVIATLLDFTPRAEVNYQPFSLEKITERALSHVQQDPMLRKSQLLASTVFEKYYAPDLPEIKCQPLEIERVIVGILKNAIQAQEATLAEHPPLVIIRTYAEPGWVAIDIEDKGIGMDEEVKSHLFELFFTTKGVGVGTGLDLAMAYHIVKGSHHGKIKVTSKKGEGTCVTIFLPQVLVL